MHNIILTIPLNKLYSFIMPVVKIKKDICKGCELCIPVCPHKCILITKKFNSKGLHYAVFSNKKSCTACKSCAIVCPDAAIEIEI